jgi:CRP/FNR family nitrogen fixation transcriptional regulator
MVVLLDGGEPVFRLLEHCVIDITLQTNQEVPGDPNRYYWRVIQGCIRTFRPTSGLRRQIDDFLLPGDIFGLENLGAPHTAAEAVTPTTLRCYPRGSVEASAARSPSVRTELRALAIMSLHKACRPMLLLGRRSALGRVASFLLEMDRRIAKANGGILLLPMGLDDIADHLGMTNEAVSHALTQLAHTASIELRRGGIELLDRFSLRQQASCTN